MSADALVYQRANHCCEYCRLPVEFSLLPAQIDHIIAQKHGGKSELANLALSCFACNSYKGPNIAGIDPATGQLCRLFNPRTDAWDDHFDMLDNGLIDGTTDVGRTTAAVLRFNLPESHALRYSLITERRMIASRTP